LAALDTAELAGVLNPPQLEAVTAPDGPLLVFAGAGSGKTRVLTYRIAHLIETGRAHPDNILAVTFTNKAAREMRGRIDTLLGPGRAPAWMGTFHSLCGRMLRRDGPLVGITRSFTIYDEGDRLQAIKRVMTAMNLDLKRFPPSSVVSAISRAKNEMLGPVEFETEANNYFADVVARIYPQYDAALRAADAVDFDDMLLLVVRMFHDNPDALQRWRHRFQHVLVDEYQDTNKVQYLLVKLLAEEHRNLCVVGDDDQSIYRFRGADVRNILSFERDFPEARIVKLEQNYRSTQNILDAAFAVIKGVPDRAEKRLWTDRGTGEKVVLAQVYDEQEEAEAVAAEARRLTRDEGRALNDIAVLYRTNAQSRALEEVLVRQGIPYKLVGGVRFYERREIKDALAYLRIVQNPADAVAFARVVNVPRRKVGDKTVEVILSAARQRNVPVWDVVADPSSLGITGPALQGLAEFRALVESLREELQRSSLQDVIELVLTRSGLADMIRDDNDDLAAERAQNLAELRGLAGEYSGLAGPEALFRFLEEASLVSDVDNLDETRAGMTLITLHMVKGLEFPIVFMTGMEEALLPHIRSIEEPGGIEEERRLCYVGMTRAMDRLYLFHAFRRHLFGTSNLNLPSRFLAELPEEIIRRPAGSTRTGAGTSRQTLLDQVARQPPAKAEPVVQRYKPGERVTHPRFGAGTVLKSSLTRTDEELIIRFDGVGIKIISASLAPLDKVQ